MHGNARDSYNVLCTRKSIMDAFWSRKTSTVLGNFRRLRQYYFDSIKVLIIKRPVSIIGTPKVRDRVGMVCVIQTLDTPGRKVKLTR